MLTTDEENFFVLEDILEIGDIEVLNTIDISLSSLMVLLRIIPQWVQYSRREIQKLMQYMP